MAITFHKVSFKNFLSVGNQPNVIFLDRVPTMLISGTNGAGKSTILDAITFGIYGKPYRNINKPQLVNSVNDRNLEVVIEFSVGSVPYKVVRGVKPSIFEIYQDGRLLDHDAASKDYQARLETIIGMNYKAFTQIVILGSARYQSFMDLSTNDRRSIIEELLDITVFSKMNSVLKTNMQNNDLENRELEYLKSIEENKLVQQDKNIKIIERRNNETNAKFDEEKARIIFAASSLDDKINAVDAELERLEEPDLNSLHNNKTSVKMQVVELQKRLRQAEDRITFYSNTHSCPECNQDISKSVADEQILMCQHEIETVNGSKTPLHESYRGIEAAITEANDTISKINTLRSDRRSLVTEKKALRNQMESLISSRQQSHDSDLEIAYADRAATEAEIARISADYITNIEERHTMEVCKALLKDDGIKAKIIKQYLPLMNNLINKNLDRMGASYSFNLDEQFNEVIKSRYRDRFTYSSFSEGEKQRISLALVFTWREIAKIKNSVNTNLLIMDEIGDSSLDGDGTDTLWEILNDMKDTNIFVISHKSSNIEKFTSHMEIYKEGNFSHIRDSKTK